MKIDANAITCDYGNYTVIYDHGAAVQRTTKKKNTTGKKTHIYKKFYIFNMKCVIIFYISVRFPSIYVSSESPILGL